MKLEKLTKHLPIISMCLIPIDTRTKIGKYSNYMYTSKLHLYHHTPCKKYNLVPIVGTYFNTMLFRHLPTLNFN